MSDPFAVAFCGDIDAGVDSMSDVAHSPVNNTASDVIDFDDSSIAKFEDEAMRGVESSVRSAAPPTTLAPL